jgi:hypothetical protein
MPYCNKFKTKRKKIKALKCHLKQTFIKSWGRQRTEIERKIGKKKNVTKVPNAEKTYWQKNTSNQN